MKPTARSRASTSRVARSVGKIYVQHRMLEHARRAFAWLEAGAHFYVCGDASRMAKDVDAAVAYRRRARRKKIRR